MRRTPSDTSQTSFRGRILTRWALAVAIGLAWLATAIPGADAQTSSKLVGNTDQHQNGVFQLNADEQGIAQTFTTGADRGAYLLESVWVVIDRSRDGRYIEIAGAIHRVEADGSRGTKVHDLTHAGVYANQAEYRFQTASAGLLIANRPYMVVISCTAGCANDNFLEFERTAWNGEDADGEADWSIADKAVKASDDWSPAGDVSNSLKIRLMGRHANKPYVESDGLTLASSPAAGDTYGAGETITLSLEFNTPVDVDTAGGTPQITMHIGDSSNPNREQNLAYARGSSTDTLVFEHIVQPTDVDADGIRIEGQSIDLNGSDITNPDNGRHAFRHFRGLNSGEPLSGHRLNGTVVTPKATLSGLSLSGVVISPAFSGDTTEYVARVASDFETTTVTATPLTGGSATIAPADADPASDGHQVELLDGPNEITITATKSGYIPITYTLMVTREERELASIEQIAVGSNPLQGNSYRRGETIAFEVTFDHEVVVDTSEGRPYLRVNFREKDLAADYDRSLSSQNFPYVRGSGTDTLTFEYIVRGNDKVVGGDFIYMRLNHNRLNLNGGAIRHTDGGRPADLTHPRQDFMDNHRLNGGRAGSIAKLSDLALSDVTLSPAFDTNTIIYIGTIEGGADVTTVTATPDGNASVTIDPADSDTSTAGHQVNLAVGINEITVTATMSDKASRNYTVAVTRHQQPEIVDVSVASDPGTDGTYATGDTINVAVTFNIEVEVDTTNGTPYIPISLRDGTRSAPYSSTDATGRVLTFSYTVVSGDSDQNGLSVRADALSLNGGTIKGKEHATDPNLEHPELPNQAGHVVNKIPRIITNGFAVVSSPIAADGTYGRGEVIRVSVTFNSDVVVDTTGGTPRLAVSIGDEANGFNPGIMLYQEGSGTDTLVFKYRVRGRDRDDNGFHLRPNQIRRNGGSIKHATTGQDADVTYPEVRWPNAATTLKVDGRLLPPIAELTDLSFSGIALSPAFDAETTSYTAAAPGSVTETTVTATAEADAVVTITPQDADANTDGHQVELPGSETVVTIEVAKANEITTTYTVTVTRNVAPVIESLSVVSNPGSDATYATGDTIDVQVTFDIDVEVDTTNGTPSISITVGDATRSAPYAATDATGQVLTFSYAVATGDSDQDGLSISADALSLNGGTVKGKDNEVDASLDHSALPNQSGHVVNKVPRIITDGLAVISNPFAATSTYGRRETISVSVTFDSEVVVDTTNGTPQLTISTGDAANGFRPRDMDYATGSGTATLVFTYAVRASDRDDNGFNVKANQIRLRGGSIKHATTDQDANLRHPATEWPDGPTTRKIDGRLLPPKAELTALSLTGVTLSPAFAAETTSYTATVAGSTTQTTVTATPETDAAATITPEDADVNADGHQVTLLEGNTVVTIAVTKTNENDTTYIATITRNALPVIEKLEISSAPLASTDTYGVGETVTITTTFDANVVVDTASGAPRLKTRIGDANNSPRDQYFAYTGGSGTTQLQFAYVVLTTDRDNDGIFVDADSIELNGSTIRDATTHQDADLSHAQPGQNGAFPGHKINGGLQPPRATLSDLSLSGINLTPVFGATTTDYTAIVASTFTSTTVSATVDMDAVVTMLPTDSDANTDGHQVSLNAGDNPVTVKVESDAMLPQTYTATVTRRTGPPSVSSIAIASEPETAPDTYGLGETIVFRVTFDTDVSVDTTNGTPRLSVSFGSSASGFQRKNFHYTDGSGTAELTFEYVVQAADRDNNGVSIARNRLSLGGGAIRDVVTGEDARLRHARPGQDGGFPEHKVDGSMMPTTPIPANLTAMGGDEQVTLAWDTPEADADIYRHEYRHKASGDDYPQTWTEIADSAPTEANEDGATVTGLTNGVAYVFQVRTVGSLGISEPSNEASAVAGTALGICDRTREVQLAILAEISGVDDCADVTAEHLAMITKVFVDSVSAGLKTGDFAGLSAVSLVSVKDSPQLTSLPPGVFEGLSAVETLRVHRNQISELPDNLFDGLTTLKNLNLDDNALTELPEGIFEHLTALTSLEAGENQIAELPNGIFDTLTSLDTLWLNDNQIAELPDGILDELSAMTDLRLDGNQLAEIPAGTLDNLPGLIDLRLDRNQLSDLPDGLFAGKESLLGLRLEGNAVDPMLIPLSLEQGEGLQFKAVAPTGAPFDIELPLSLVNASITGGATTTAIAIGETESAFIAVTRDSGAHGNMTANFGALPSLPTDHSGYTLSKSADLPIIIARGGVSGVAISSDPGSDGTYATGDVVRFAVTSDVPVDVDTTSGTPQLAITIGNAVRTADYSATDATKRVLTFSYKVVSSDSDQNGIAVAANSLSLGGGAITAAGETDSAKLDHPALPDQSGHLVNRVPKIVANGIYLVSTPRAAPNTYGVKETITVAVEFDSDVVVDRTGGTPKFRMRFQNAGGTATDVDFSYARGSGGTTLEFDYVVKEDDADDNGVQALANQFRRNGGTIRHSSTEKDAILDYAAPGPDGVFPNHKVDGSLALTLVELCGARLGPTQHSPREGILDLCWDLSITIPTGSDTVIELRDRDFWDPQDTHSGWTEVARGNNYTRCHGNTGKCLKHTLTELLRANTKKYQLRVREGNAVFATSAELAAQAPNYNANALDAKLSGCYLPGGFTACTTPQGPFWVDLELSDPSMRLFGTERVRGLQPSDFAVTNGAATSVTPVYGGAYQVVIQPTTLGQPVTIQLPANRVKGVGEGLSPGGGNNFTRNNNASNTHTVETAAP